MQNVLFLNKETPSKAEVKRLGEHLIQIIGDVEKNTSGFHLINDVGSVYGKYEDFTTLYKEIEGSFVLSNDGSVYVEPEPVPEPEPYEPSLEEVQEAKVQEMNGAQQAAFREGINVTRKAEPVEKLRLPDNDQPSLEERQERVLAGKKKIQWQPLVETGH